MGSQVLIVIQIITRQES